MPRRARREGPIDSVRPRTPQRPWQQGGEEGSFGSWLRQQREIRNLTLREISDSTKIGMRYLEALEDDRFDVLPAGVFARGFLREYAKYVGLDADEVVNFFLADERERHQGEEEEVEVMASRSAGQGRQVWVLTGLAVALVVGILAIVYLVEHHRTDASEPVESAPPMAAPVPVPVTPPVTVQAPAQQISAPEQPIPGLPLKVTLGFTGECWVEATVDDHQPVSELRVQGESMQLSAEKQVMLTLGNPSAVRIEVNGHPYPLDVRSGKVVRDLVIDLAAAKAAVRGGEESPGG